MQQHTLGKNDMTVSTMGLGTMGMTSFYGPTDEKEAVRVIHRAIELGVTFFDTAEAYGPFTNERLVGQAIKGQRAKVVIATKFAWKWLDNGNATSMDVLNTSLKPVKGHSNASK